MTITLNQITRGQTLWRSVHLETDVTTCSHIEIDNSAFSDARKSYLFLCNTSKKVIVTWLRCKHCMAIASSQAGQVLITFCRPNMHISTLNYNTHRVVDIKTSMPGHHQKGSHHWTDIIPINIFIRISQYLQPFQVTP